MRKLLSFSCHDFNVHAASASGNQCEADRLLWLQLHIHISYVYYGSKEKKMELWFYIFLPYVVMYEKTQNEYCKQTTTTTIIGELFKQHLYRNDSVLSFSIHISGRSL